MLYSNFDCDYAFTLGGAVATLMTSRMNGYLATVTGLKMPAADWKVRAYSSSSTSQRGDVMHVSGGLRIAAAFTGDGLQERRVAIV